MFGIGGITCHASLPLGCPESKEYRHDENNRGNNNHLDKAEAEHGVLQNRVTTANWTERKMLGEDCQLSLLIGEGWAWTTLPLRGGVGGQPFRFARSFC